MTTTRTATAPAVDVPEVQRRSIAVLASAQVLTGVAVAGAVPAGALIAAGVAGNEAAAGLAQTAGVVGAAFASLPLARLTLSGGRRTALGAGLLVGAVGAAAVVFGAQLRFLPLVFLGCMLVGGATAAGYQARYAAADLAPPERRGRDLSLVVWASTIGAVLGPNLLGVSGSLAEHLGLPPLAGPYVVAAFCLSAAGLVVVSLLRPDPFLLARRLAGAAVGGARPHVLAGLHHLRGHPRAWLGMAAVAVGHAAMVMVMVMTPVHMSHVEVRLQLIGLVISVHVAGMYALSPLVGWAADRLGRVPVLAAGVADPRRVLPGRGAGGRRRRAPPRRRSVPARCRLVVHADRRLDPARRGGRHPRPPSGAGGLGPRHERGRRGGRRGGGRRRGRLGRTVPCVPWCASRCSSSRLALLRPACRAQSNTRSG